MGIVLHMCSYICAVDVSMCLYRMLLNDLFEAQYIFVWRITFSCYMPLGTRFCTSEQNIVHTDTNTYCNIDSIWRDTKRIITKEKREREREQKTEPEAIMVYKF